MRRLAHLLWLLTALAVPVPSAGQGEPERPPLPQGADPNDWEAYYDYGAANLVRFPVRSGAAFYWASRLDPSRAEPLFGRWVAFWLGDVGRFEAYLQGDERVARLPVVLAADSVRYRAILRNPFVHHALEVVLYDQLPGEWRRDRATQAWLQYAQGNPEAAARLLAPLTARDDGHRPGLHYQRALALVATGQADSAAVEIARMLAKLRARDAAVVAPLYQSKAVLEYGLGRLYRARGDRRAARDAYSRALMEDLSLPEAHAELADLAAEEGDAETAVREYATALELDGSDGYLRHRYGLVLLRAGRGAEALDQLRKATELEPYYSEAWFNLGVVAELQGSPAEALAAYRQFLRHAPRRRAELVARAQARVAALAAGPAA
jgi:Tfp pilus assembly protein PilF